MPLQDFELLPPESGQADGQQPTIVVAVLTCQRNHMLEQFLIEFARTAAVPGARTILLVVDNDKDGTARPIVDRHRDQIPELRYVVETNPGIPVARNRALDEARALEADILCFIDDDEYPDQEWLVKLVNKWQQTGANLIGGPVCVAPPCPTLGRWQKFINSSLAARQHRKNRAMANWPHSRGPTIVTNNWLCDMHWLKQTAVRFNERLLVTGGSDTAFYRAAIAEGCKTAWCPDAVVYESIEPNRLSLRYQFWRGQSQSITNFHLKNQRFTPLFVAVTTLNAVTRFLLGCLLFVLPVFGVASLIMSVRSMGWAVGRIQGLFGLRSKLYERSADVEKDWDESDAEDVLDGLIGNLISSTGTDSSE